jgi:hypothetical protein
VSRGSLWQWAHAGMLTWFGYQKCCPTEQMEKFVPGSEGCCCCGAQGSCPVRHTFQSCP